MLWTYSNSCSTCHINWQLFYALAKAESKNVTSLLERMESAQENLNYSGSFVYEHDGNMETIRIVHRANSNVFGERLYSLTGPEREIIRTKESVWCYLPDQKLGIHEYRQLSGNKFSGIRRDQYASIAQNYFFKLKDRERVAERSAQRLSVIPRDEFRYGYELWIDEVTGLLLRSDLLDMSGEIIERYMFAEIEIGGQIQDSELTPRYPKEDFVWYGLGNQNKETGKTNKIHWRAGKLPEGFQKSASLIRISPMDNLEMEHLVFSDGMASVSMFIKPTSSNDLPIGAIRMGGISAFSINIGDYVITALGEVPMSSVKMIAMNATVLD